MTKYAQGKRFEGFVNELSHAKNREEITNILYRIDGVDRAYQKEELTTEQQNTLFHLARVLTAANI